MHARALLGLTCGRGVSRALTAAWLPPGSLLGRRRARPSSKAGRGGVECQDPPRCSEETRAPKGRLHGLARLRWGRRPVSGEAT